MKHTILVVEDEPALREGLVDALEFQGYGVSAAADGASGLSEALTGRFDLIVLDIMLPRLDGFDLLARVREQGVATPVILLTARGEEEDRVRGLSIGADDYVVKPFSLRELIERIRARLRPRGGAAGPELRAGELVVDLDRCEGRRGEIAFALTPRESEILRYLHLHRERVVPRDELLLKVWGYPTAAVETRTVDIHIAKLRQKVESDPERPAVIVTVRGAGYRIGSNVVRS